MRGVSQPRRGPSVRPAWPQVPPPQPGMRQGGQTEQNRLFGRAQRRGEVWVVEGTLGAPPACRGAAEGSLGVPRDSPGQAVGPRTLTALWPILLTPKTERV